MLLDQILVDADVEQVSALGLDGVDEGRQACAAHPAVLVEEETDLPGVADEPPQQLVVGVEDIVRSHLHAEVGTARIAAMIDLDVANGGGHPRAPRERRGSAGCLRWRTWRQKPP